MSNLSDLNSLAEAIRLLQNAHEIAEDRIKKEMPGVNPLEVQTEDGRFILLDSLTAIVNAKSALYIWEHNPQ